MKKKCLTISPRIFLVLSCFAATSCATYTAQNSDVRDDMYSGNFNSAIEKLDNSSLATQDRNYALFRMEKGMLLYLNNDFKDAVPLWNQADAKLDSLYTTSISSTAASFVINDSMSDYEGEAHERVLLPIFSSMAFFADNNLNNAQVMVRRTYDVLSTLHNNDEGKDNFKYDAYSHYFSALIYEAKKDWDSAIVEYKNALNNIDGQNSNESERQEIIKSLGRIAEYRNRKEILLDIKRKYPNVTWMKQLDLLNEGEVYFVYESGKSPIKVPEDIVVPAGKTVVRISFPTFKEIPYTSHYADVYIGDKFFERTVKMEDIGKMAEQALSDRRVRDIAKMAARVIAKDAAAKKLNDENPFAGLAANIFNVATEVADTRSWTSLPDTIQIARIPVPPGKPFQFSVRPEGSLAKSFMVVLQPGEKKLIRLRTFN